MPLNYFPGYGGYNQFQPQMGAFPNGNMQMPQSQQNISPVQPVQQNGGFIRVQSEDEARRYPVAPGGSITFIDDNSPHCYVKTVGLSPVDAPIFKRFRLVEEAETPSQSAGNGDISNEQQKDIDLSIYAKNDDIRELREECDGLRRAIDKLKFDIDALADKSTKKMVQRARKDADEE